jgi:hypothetical protein
VPGDPGEAVGPVHPEQQHLASGRGRAEGRGGGRTCRAGSAAARTGPRPYANPAERGQAEVD